MSEPLGSRTEPRNERRERFLALLSEHEAQLFGFLRAITPNYQDAEDLCQQAVLTMWQKFDTFEQGTSFLAWACQIARFKAMNLIKARKLTPLDADVLDLLVVSQQEQGVEYRQARRRALRGCLDKLSGADRELVETAYAADRSIKELAADRGRSLAGVYNSLSRIRAALHRCISAALSREGFA